MVELGKQYLEGDSQADKTGFKAKARLHQSRFRAEKLKLPCVYYGNILTPEDGIIGKNFYPDFDVFEAVKGYRPYNKPLYSNMLRSEHIPFNLFIPLRHDLAYSTAVFNSILGGCVKSIDSHSIIDKKENLKVEFAPKPKKNYLNDRTSFDVYIEYNHVDNSRGMIGIEVKYTEGEYEFSGETEKKAFDNLTSKYYTVA